MSTRRRGGRIAGRDFSALVSEAPRAQKIAENAPSGQIQPVQRLVLDGFPTTDTTRDLSPNGRTHWATKRRAVAWVATVVTVGAERDGLRPVAGPVRLLFRYVFPVRRKRDVDNLTTGVTKAAIDALVRGRWLEADDSEHVVEVKAEAVYERGRRRLEIVIEPATSADAAGQGGAG